MKRIFLLLIISISILTSCFPPDDPSRIDYKYNYTIILIKNSIPIDTLYNTRTIEIVDSDLVYNENNRISTSDVKKRVFVSDTFYYAKEDILESEYIVINDLILIEHLSDLTGIQLALAYYSTADLYTIRNSDCDSIATCFYRNEEDYK